MSTLAVLTPEMTVDEVLARWPEAAPAFVRRRLYCVGCYMARFDTLSDVARIYGLALEPWLDELRQAIHVEEEVNS